MKQLQKLPIGIQAFETIRRNDYLYIDKTEYMTLLIYSDFENQDTRHCGRFVLCILHIVSIFLRS